jgi:hypothetical protein
MPTFRRFFEECLRFVNGNVTFEKNQEMEPSDIIFYVIIAISIIGSIVKAVNKGKVQEVAPEQPASKKTLSGEIIRSILEELEDKDEDYIPKNTAPKPAAAPVAKPAYILPSAPKPAAAHSHTSSESITPDFWADGAYASTEDKPRREEMVTLSHQQAPAKVEDSVYVVLESLHLSSTDEMKKAVIYSEILRPKF